MKQFRLNRVKDLTGKRFGRLSVSAMEGRSARGYYWQCVCDCGAVVSVQGAELRHKETRSCGCYHRQRSSEANRKHGESNSREFRCWIGILTRCRSPKSTIWKYYGGRGIKVCKRWHKFSNFLSDMGRKPTPHHTIERNDYNGDYKPSNCRWATRKEQANNSRKCRVIKAFGRSQNIKQWSEETKLSDSLIWARIYRLGWPVELALSAPADHTKRKNVDFDTAMNRLAEYEK